MDVLNYFCFRTSGRCSDCSRSNIHVKPIVINYWKLLQYCTCTNLLKMRKYLFVPNPLQIGKLGLTTPPHPPVRENCLLLQIQTFPRKNCNDKSEGFLMTNKFYGGSARNWSTLDSVEIVQDGEKFAKFNVSVISAPAEYSFHCQLGLCSMLNCTYLSTFLHFQIQGFNIENNQFSYASDCTGFFTPGIWMGLVTSIILLWILAYGIHMIMQLTTNSRFDDPKGAALSVPQTE
uniref:Uncharacterized protein n=1 Tax=Accipiter nisus TaxID=211598 RepID=A0A8B9MRL0_9AVES